MRGAILLGAVLLAGCASPDVPELRGVGVPGAVKAFVARREDCNHWAGEDAYDAARGREIERAVNRLHCDRLDDEATALKARYGADPRVAKAIDESADW